MAGTAAGIVNGAVTATVVTGAATVTIAVIGQSGAMIVAGATIADIIEAAAATWAAAEEATNKTIAAKNTQGGSRSRLFHCLDLLCRPSQRFVAHPDLLRLRQQFVLAGFRIEVRRLFRRFYHCLQPAAYGAVSLFG